MEGGGRRSPPPKDKGGGLCDGMGGDGNLDGGLLEGARSGLDDLSCGLKYVCEGVEDGGRMENTCEGGSLDFDMEEPNNFSGQVTGEGNLVDGGGEGMLWEMVAEQELKDGRVDAGGDAKPCGRAIDQEMKGGENLVGAVARGGRLVAGVETGGRKLMEGAVMEGVTASLIPRSAYGKGIELVPDFNPSNYSILESNYDLSNLPIKFQMGPRFLLNGDKGNVSSNYSSDLETVTPRILNLVEDLGTVGVGDMEGKAGVAGMEEFTRADCVLAAANIAGSDGESHVAGVQGKGGAERAAEVANAGGAASDAEMEISGPKMMNSKVGMDEPVAKEKNNSNKQPTNAWKNKVQKLINVGAVKDFSRDESTVIMDHVKSQTNSKRLDGAIVGKVLGCPLAFVPSRLGF